MNPLFRFALILTAMVGVAGCAHDTTKPLTAPVETAAPDTKQAAPTAAPAEPNTSTLPDDPKLPDSDLPKQKLSNDILYGFLIGEMAAQRGNYSLAAQTFLELTRRTRDPRLARRAVEMAIVARQPQTAIEATRLWVATEPDAAEAHYAMAQVALQTGQQQSALDEIRKATTLKPGWESAVLLEAQLLQRIVGGDAARERLAAHLQTHPLAYNVRINYGRLLWAEKKFPEARAEFERVLKDNPANLDVLITVAELSAQLQDYDSAERYFKRVLEEDGRNNDLARIYLGQVAEARKRYDEALVWYASVGPGEHQMTAQFRHAQLQVKQGNLDGALAFLRQIVPSTNQQRVQIAMAEASILNAAKRDNEAFDVLATALDKLPNDSELLYRHAMAAEKVGRLDVMESSLRKLIKLQPDHAHAYNALGYAFADRNERLAEAHELIDKAVKLAPDDYFIMDSMGWVLYRQGKHGEAIEWLQRAYAGRADAEIAAHLGEVLWQSGRRDEAQKMWEEALAKSPENETLVKTVQRLKP
ncbi:MAG TPA: tetratricopeptide repeat protein [Burkholderiales bacterium]|nr:tetratricopeptide repeat protein [Burkholderiales bacterium]